MAGSISPELLSALALLPTCTVANAIELLDTRLRNVGFTNSTIHCCFPEFSPLVGYAVTLRLHGANPPMEGGLYVQSNEWWDELSRFPEPRILVIEDADRRPGTAAFIGETHAAILQALGCVAAITNGAVRDVDQVAKLGFQLFSGATSVSHAYAHVARVEGPVTVGGLTIASGDLLHGDRHGVVKVPPEGVERIIEIASKLRHQEREIVRYCKSDKFSREGLQELLRKLA